jgi:hypothetical protein
MFIGSIWSTGDPRGPDMTAPTRTDDRQVTARRLLDASRRHSLDPDADIDWAAPPVPGAYWAPPELCSLHGTDLWAGLTAEQRIELSKHELCAYASAGIWFEAILMQMLLRHLYDTDRSGDRFRYGLVEIADECRHSTMFARLISHLGCPDYSPRGLINDIGRAIKSWSNTTVTFGATLFVEEVLDAMQRLTMADEAVQPLVRQVCRLHVIEEARHIRYARVELAQVAAELPAAERAISRMLLAGVAAVIMRRLPNPEIYAAVGIRPADGHAAAMASPHWRATRRRLCGKVLGFLDEQGLVGPVARRAILAPAGLHPGRHQSAPAGPAWPGRPA